MRKNLIYLLAAIISVAFIFISRLGLAAEDYNFGVAFGDTYRGQAFMPYIRDLNINFTKVCFTWQQLESRKGEYKWAIFDNLLKQIQHGDEVLISVRTSSLWDARPIESKAYYNFIYNLVKRARGRIKFWQNEDGAKEDYVGVLKIFYKAVKDAQPDAIVVAGEAFFDDIFKAGRDYFDVFDIKLYGDIYNIPYRVDRVKEKMRHYGFQKPVISSEYGGPTPEQIPESKILSVKFNQFKQEFGLSQAAEKLWEWAAAEKKKGRLSPQAEMFLSGASPDLEKKRDRIECRDITQRLILGLSSGVKRFLLWDLSSTWDSHPKYGTNPLFGKLRLMSNDFSQKYPAYYAYQRMSKKLKGVVSVERVKLDNDRIYLFEVTKKDGTKLYVIWEKRDYFLGEGQPPTAFQFPTAFSRALITDVFGREEIKTDTKCTLLLEITDTPLFIEAL